MKSIHPVLLTAAACVLTLAACAYTGVSYTIPELKSLEETRGSAVKLARNDNRIARGVFFPGPKMWYPRCGHSMFLLADGNVLVTGGQPGAYGDNAPPELFQSQLNIFLPAPGERVPIGKILADGTVTVNDKPLGEGNDLKMLGLCFAHTHWRTLRLFGGDPLLLPGHKILVPAAVMTSDVDNKNVPRKALLYDIDKQTSQLIEGTHNNCEGGFSAQLLDDGRLLLAGGMKHCDDRTHCFDPALYLDSTEIFDPKTGKFRIGPKMNVHRTAAGSVKLRDGRVLILGGIIGRIGGHGPDNDIRHYLDNRPHFLASNTAEIYDPRTSSFTLTNPMSVNRVKPVAVLLKTGEVLVFDDLESASTEAEIFDPSTNSFSFAGFMTEPRTGADAILLPNGDVLITGGLNRPFTVTPVPTGHQSVRLNTSEIFRVKEVQHSPTASKNL